MNNFIKQVIEEKVNLRKKNRSYRNKETQSNDNKEVTEKEIDEIVDENGNINRGKIPTDIRPKYIVQNKTSDEVAGAIASQMGNLYGSRANRRLYGESKYYTKKEIMEIQLGNSLGGDATILKDKTYDEALHYFTKKLGLDKETAIEKMSKLGYSSKLPNDTVIMVEYTKNFIEEFVDELIKNRHKDNDIIEKEEEDINEINPIVMKQIKSLKNSIKSHKLSEKQILKLLNTNE